MRITEGRHDVDSDLLCEDCGYFPCQCDEPLTPEESKQRLDDLQERPAPSWMQRIDE